MSKDFMHIFRGREIKDYKDVRWALSLAKTAEDVCEFIKAYTVWQPGERETYLSELQSFMMLADSDEDQAVQISPYFCESTLMEVEHEIKCLGQKDYMTQGLGLFLKQYSN